MSLARLCVKLKKHPVLGKARTWAWVAPGNVPDPIALAVIAARLQKAELILKLSRRNEKTGRAVVRRCAAKGQKIRITIGYGDFKKLASRADAWVVYGSDATLEALRCAAPPAAGWVGHGHRISFSVIFGSRLRGPAAIKRAAKACARDIHPHDQLGCLSPQIIWIEGAQQARSFAAALQQELERIETAKGRAQRDPETLRMRRTILSELSVRALDPEALEILQDLKDRSGDPVVYRLDHGGFLTPAGGQIIAVKSFASPNDIRHGMKLFQRHLQGISAAGTHAERAAIKKLFSKDHIVYFTTPGRLQTPPLDWQL